MNLLSTTGLLSLAGGGCLYGYQALRAIMDEQNAWNEFYLVDAGIGMINSLPDTLPAAILQQGAEFLIYDLPLYQFLIGLGILLFIIGSMFKR